MKPERQVMFGIDLTEPINYNHKKSEFRPLGNDTLRYDLKVKQEKGIQKTDRMINLKKQQVREHLSHSQAPKPLL